MTSFLLRNTKDDICIICLRIKVNVVQCCWLRSPKDCVPHKKQRHTGLEWLELSQINLTSADSDCIHYIKWLCSCGSRIIKCCQESVWGLHQQALPGDPLNCRCRHTTVHNCVPGTHSFCKISQLVHYFSGWLVNTNRSKSPSKCSLFSAKCCLCGSRTL